MADGEPSWGGRLLAAAVVFAAIGAAVFVAARPGWSGGERFVAIVVGSTLGALALMVPWVVVQWRGRDEGDGAS